VPRSAIADVPSNVQAFVERHEGHDRLQLKLRCSKSEAKCIAYFKHIPLQVSIIKRLTAPAVPDLEQRICLAHCRQQEAEMAVNKPFMAVKKSAKQF
jgi:hypothetical protein